VGKKSSSDKPIPAGVVISETLHMEFVIVGTIIVAIILMIRFIYKRVFE
jgi:hypothetical protein